MKNTQTTWLRLGAVGLTLLATLGCSDGDSGANAEKHGPAGADGAVGNPGAPGERGATGARGEPGEDGVQASGGELVATGETLQWVSTFKTGSFEQGASEIVAFHPDSRRVFVVNAALGQVQVLTMSEAGQLTKAERVIDPAQDITGFAAGGVNSVAVHGDLVAIAVENESKVLAGKVAFYDAHSLSFLADVDVGALPDMVTFTPDGTRVLVANEGEQQRDDELAVEVDPAGTVSVIDLRGGVDAATVVQLDFTAFDARLEELRAKGVRYFPGVVASGSAELEQRPLSKDLEPEYIAVSPDGAQAMVTLQENNALAVIDLTGASPSVVDVRPLGLKDWSRGLPEIQSFPIPDAARPVLGSLDTSAGARELLLGGLSALYFEKVSKEVYSFLTIPDRGPQIDPADLNSEHAGTERPHVMGDAYQATVYRYAFDADEGEFVGLPDAIPLYHQDGGAAGSCHPVRGLANSPVLDAGEFAVDLVGRPLGWSALDGDFEGLAVDPDGDGYWLVDEYRPAVYFFERQDGVGCATAGQSAGVLKHRWVPAGTAAAAGEVLSVWGGVRSDAGETLPGHYLERRANRGFEAVAIDAAREVLYAFIQSPLDHPGARSKDVIRILALDIDESSAEFGRPVAEYLYFLEGAGVGLTTDKIGDAVFDPTTGRLLAIERDDAFGALGKKYVFELDLSGATNVLGIDDAAAPFETLEVDALIETYGVRPVSKRKVVNLPSAGYVAGDKAEGLALITDGDLAGALAVMNDNDFGLEPTLDAQGKVQLSTEYQVPVLGLVTFTQSNGLDASDRDGGIQLANWPVFGMYMPDAVAAYAVDGHTYYVTANEGDSRDYDEARVRGSIGDEIDAALGPVSDAQFGRLKFSSLDGDLDGDGDVDQIQTYGARSLSVWDALGNLVWDSGDLLERVTALAAPANFNSDNAENLSFDSRSDDKGPEPEGIVVGQVGERWFAFVGLERVGGIAVFDVSRPAAPVFVDYVTSRDFVGNAEYGAAGDLGPEGLAFVPAAESPTGAPLLLVGHEVSGTTSVFQVNL